MAITPGDTIELGPFFDPPTLAIKTDLGFEAQEDVVVVQDGSVTLVGVRTPTVQGRRRRQQLHVHKVYNNSDATTPQLLAVLWRSAHHDAVDLASRFMNFGD